MAIIAVVIISNNMDTVCGDFLSGSKVWFTKIPEIYFHPEEL